MMFAAASTALSPLDADRLRSFERRRLESLAKTYRDFFTPITALAITSLLEAYDSRAESSKRPPTSNYPSLSRLAQVEERPKRACSCSFMGMSGQQARPRGDTFC
jgi:hypothetical protein